MLHRNIDRMQAELDYRHVAVVAHGMSGGDGLNALVDDLQRQIGTIAEVERPDRPQVPKASEVPVKTMEEVMNVEFDKEGFEALKGLGRL